MTQRGDARLSNIRGDGDDPRNPFTDLLAFLTGSAHDYNPFGDLRYVSVLFYLAVIGGSFYIAWRNWQDDPAQRTGATWRSG